ncbi:MAG: DNA primase [bacterium]|nr:DNA primase [bacterium]
MAGRDVDLIKERVGVVDLVRSYLTLMPAGRNFKALCPFHGEKTPSFIVSPERKTWHCFGCGKGGDVIRFVMEYENLEFREALRFLAERAGIEIRSLDPQAEREFGVLYDIHEHATAFYMNELRNTPLPRQYLESRTLTLATMEHFQLGFAPGGETLTMHLTKQGFAIEDIARAGLAGKTTSGLYRDRFQNRIIFPLANHIGKVVAFTGRLWGPAPQGVDLPKYLNSSETPIFSKSKILFGLNKTKNDIARSRTAVLVEGQMDLLLAWQSGVQNVVAVSGTGLTGEHLLRLRRLADTLLVSFDNDEAGTKALDRALDTLSPYDFHVQAIDLKEYKDPGEACERDPAFLARAVEVVEPAFTRLVRRIFTSAIADDVAARKRAVRSLLMKIRRLTSSVEQNEWLRALATASGVPQVTLLTELAELTIGDDGRPSAPPTAEVVPKSSRREIIAARLTVLAFTNRDFFATVRQHITLLPEPYRGFIEQPESEAAALQEMQASLPAGRQGARAGDDPVRIRAEFNELLAQLEIEELIVVQRGLRTKLRVAEASGNDEEVEQIGASFQALSRQLDELRSRS